MTELSLETYARLLAHIACRRGTRTSDLLSELGIDAEGLHAAEGALREQLASSRTMRRGIAAMNFAEALGAELKRLGPLGGDGAAPPPPDIVPVLADAPEVRETSLPSYLQERGGLVAPPISPSPAVPPDAPAVVRAAASPFAETTNMDLSAVVAAVQKGALPFAGSGSTTAGTADASKGQQPVVGAPVRRVGSGTEETNWHAVKAAISQGPLPFARPDLPEHGRGEVREELDFSLLPLESYASVSAALARGESREAALSKLGLTSAAFDILARAWAQRFQQEPKLLERFKELARSGAAGGTGGEGPR
jgi:hypothetical protein